MKGSGARLYQAIARELEQAIEQGTYGVGRLPAERELAEQYDVSRPVIREALIVLELRGLVQTRAGAGVFVSPRSKKLPAPQSDTDAGPFEVVEARRMLEGEVAALAATTATAEDMTELERNLALIGDARLDQAAREQADRAFHLTLARATRNDVLVAMVEDLWDRRYQSPLCVYFFSRARDAGIQPPEEEHRPILEAIKARDADAARQAMRLHLTRVTENLLHATEADVMDRARLRVEERRFDFARRAGLEV